jgi:LAS seventeen-binding protein 5
VFTEKGKSVDGAASDLVGLSLGGSGASNSPAPPQPARPARKVEESDESEEDEEEDEDNPFGDSNALDTPGYEKDEPKW